MHYISLQSLECDDQSMVLFSWTVYTFGMLGTNDVPPLVNTSLK